MRKVVLISIFLIFLILIGGFSYLSFKQKRNFSGTLKLKVYPPFAKVKIDNKDYPLLNGNLKTKLKKGEHYLHVFSTGYLNDEEKIIIEPNKITSIEDIYLLPLNWPKKILVENQNIKALYLSSDKNRLLYLLEKKEKNSKENYQWFIFDRNSKANELVYESDYFPKNISFVSKKILFQTKNNNWQIILPPTSLLRDLNIVTQSLNSLFEKQLKENQEFSNKKIESKIIKAVFLKNDENKVIIQTPQNLFFYDLLEDNLLNIYEGKTSDFILDKENLYFLSENGLLNKVSLKSPLEIKTLSLFSFENKNLEKVKISKKENSEEFIILNSDGRLYYLISKENAIPQIILDNADEGNFINEKLIAVKENGKEDEWLVYNLKDSTKTVINSQIPPLNFLKEDYFLILKDNKLKIENLKNNSFVVIEENVLKEGIFFDKVLKTIFFIYKGGIVEVSY